MEATGTTVQELAAIAASSFKVATRADESTFTRRKDDAPEWVESLCFAAHGTDADGSPAFLPDDWRYRWTAEACEAIAAADPQALEDGDVTHAFADGAVSVYTGGLISWLGSNLQRVGYCDEAHAEYGGDVRSIIDYMALGQYEEAREVFELVLGFLTERAEA